MAVAFSWDVLVTDGLLAAIAEAGGLERAETVGPLGPAIVRILQQTGGVPIAARAFDADERTRVARTLLHEATQRLLRLLGGRGPAPPDSSVVGQLKAMVDEAAAGDKDLVGGMVARLKRDILVARNRLDAMQPPG